MKGGDQHLSDKVTLGSNKPEKLKDAKHEYCMKSLALHRANITSRAYNQIIERYLERIRTEVRARDQTDEVRTL